MIFEIVDPCGNNYVDSVTREIDKFGLVYYEIKGRNSKQQQRIVRLYAMDNIKFFIINAAGDIEPAKKPSVVHKQIKEKLQDIFNHFNIPTPLNFGLSVKKDMPHHPAVLPKVEVLDDADVPSKEFFLKAASRAIQYGDKVSSNQTGVHSSRQSKIGLGSKYYNEGNSTRLNLLNELVNDNKEGYFPYAATTAYGLSLLTYIATHIDHLDTSERKRLYQLYKVIAGDIPRLDLAPNTPEYRQALAKGLKAEVNEITALRERSAILRDVEPYTRDLVYGNPLGRPIIDKQTSQNVLAGYGADVRREIPAFFPIPPNPNSVDQIVLQAGGCKTHSAIVCIWKQAIDAEGQVIVAGSGQAIERYRVYRTVCNAGFGTTFNVQPTLYHEACHTDSMGRTYSVCTQEVLLADDIPYSHEVMQRQVESLINVERQLLLFYDLPKKGPNGEIASSDKVKQAQWRQLNQSIKLGRVELELSALTMPQVTGNCTVRSIQEYTRWELMRMGVSQDEAEDILNRHWNFAKKYDSASITPLLETYFVIKDGLGDNYVDSVNRQLDDKGEVYYEFKARNSSHQLRILRFYAGKRIYLAEDAEGKIVEKKGVVHQQIETNLHAILRKFNVTLDFSISKAIPKPAILNAPVAMNIVEDINQFFLNPEIPNFPEFKPDEATPEETNTLVEAIQTNQVQCPKPKMMRLSNLLTAEIKKPKSVSNAVGLFLLEHCDAYKLASFDCMQGSIHQVASQFNNGESTGRHLTPPNLFKEDHTQGPAEQRTSGGAAMARYAHREFCDCFGELLHDPQIAQQFGKLFNYQFGYLTPQIGKEKECVDFLSQHVDKLLLNIERVAIDGKPSQHVIQVLNSGMAIGQYDLPGRHQDASKFLNQMTSILLGAQYQAVAKVAILEAQQNPNKRIPVIFTMVGGGVFGNDKKMIAKAISQAIAYIRNSGINNLDICLSIFTTKEIQIYQAIAAQEGQEYADLRELLSKPSLTQDKLENLKALPQQKQESRILPLILLGLLTAVLVAATTIMGLLTFGVGFSAIPFVPGIIGLIIFGITAMTSAIVTGFRAFNYYNDSDEEISNAHQPPMTSSYETFSQHLTGSPTQAFFPIANTLYSPVTASIVARIPQDESLQNNSEPSAGYGRKRI